MRSNENEVSPLHECIFNKNEHKLTFGQRCLSEQEVAKVAKTEES